MKLLSTPESEAYNTAFGTALHRLRQRNGLTQEEVADSLRRSKSLLCKYETGVVNIALCPWELVILAQMFRVQPEEIFLLARDIQKDSAVAA